MSFLIRATSFIDTPRLERQLYYHVNEIACSSSPLFSVLQPLLGGKLLSSWPLAKSWEKEMQYPKIASGWLMQTFLFASACQSFSFKKFLTYRKCLLSS